MFFRISLILPLVHATCPYIVEEVCNTTKTEYGVGPNLVFLPHKKEDGWHFEFPVCNFGQIATNTNTSFEHAAKILAWVEFTCNEFDKVFEFHPILTPGIHHVHETRPYPSNDPYMVGPITKEDVMQCNSDNNLVGRFVRCKTYDPINTNCSEQQYPHNIAALKNNSVPYWNCIETHANIPINHELTSLELHVHTLKTHHSDVDVGVGIPDDSDGCCCASDIALIVFVVILGTLVFCCLGILAVGCFIDRDNEEGQFRKDYKGKSYDNKEPGSVMRVLRALRVASQHVEYAKVDKEAI